MKHIYWVVILCSLPSLANAEDIFEWDLRVTLVDYKRSGDVVTESKRNLKKDEQAKAVFGNWVGEVSEEEEN